MTENNNDGYHVYSTLNKDCTVDICEEPTVDDANLKVEVISAGLKYPTTMAFLGNDDMLVLELNGTVRRILDNVLQPEPLLDVNVSKITGERGLLGISISKEIPGHTYLFLYYTESRTDNGEPLGNRLYRYELINNRLLNPTLLLDLPAFPGPYHNGGAITIGPDNNIYLPVGDLDNLDDEERPTTLAQNIEDGQQPNGSGGILRVDQNGNIVKGGIIGIEYPLNLYYAYGVRNSFGIDFDPVTGKLWDTENGPNYGDEINLVEPGFNSGWRRVQGIWENEDGKIGDLAPETPASLVDFGGKGNYSTPEFIWKNRYGPTAIKFLDSDKLGKKYMNDMFVGDVRNGNIYRFELNEQRTELLLNGVLQDKVADDDDELGDIIFGHGFEGGITDLEIGPDGYLYIVSGAWSDEGKIYRLAPLK
jgi:glucose/arabinose dehydrogenase